MGETPGTALDEDLKARDRQTPLRAWGLCGLMLLATMLNYMDRQTLAQQASHIREELSLNNEDYGWLETGFGLAFAFGAIATGALADRVSLRWLYPAILLGWSAVGFATGWVTNFWDLLACRIALGFFESGQWPCALAAAQRLLPSRQRTLGNSILQSGASLGAIVTPPVVLLLNKGEPGGWRLPFQAVGAVGILWAVAWLLAVRPHDLKLADEPAGPTSPEPREIEAAATGGSRDPFGRRLFALVVVVISINLCWQYFRAWMPMMLEKQYGYSNVDTQKFSSLYYLVAGIGCLLVGLAARGLSVRGWTVHGARMVTFTCCVLLTALSTLTAFLDASWLLLAIFLAIGFGSLGQFPTYYAFTQELSVRKMGKVTGILSFVTWVAVALVQSQIGKWIDRTGSYFVPTFLAGLIPALGLLSLVILWGDREKKPATAEAVAA